MPYNTLNLLFLLLCTLCNNRKMIFTYKIEDSLKLKFKKFFKKRKNLYESCMNKISEIIKNPEHYKPLRHDLKNIRRVHLIGPFIMVFTIEGNIIKFLDVDHHDKIYKKRF